MKSYSECCEGMHLVGGAPTPEGLITSRYSAYASGNVDYIIATTSKKSEDYSAFMDSALAPKNGTHPKKQCNFV